MFTRTQWYEFFRTYGLDANDAQASAEQAFQDQFDAPDMALPPMTAQPKAGLDPYVNGVRSLFSNR